MSEIQEATTDPPADQQPEVEIDLNDMGDRFKVAEYLLKLRDNPPFAEDQHPAARFVGEVVAAFADERMRALMGADQEEKGGCKCPFTDDETAVLKDLVAQLQQPAPAPAPVQRPAPQAPPQPARQRQQAPVATPHIPGRRGAQGPLPQVGTVQRGPLSRPILSKEEMEATTHAQSQVVARRARNAFLSFRTGANPGRDHSGSDED